MATAAQIEANHRNAVKSTGPRTEDGKVRSRRNALKHGLAGRELLPDQDEAALQARIVEWFAVLQPDPGWPMWLAELVARESLRVERSAREDSAMRAVAALRAEHSWDDDRLLEAANLGKGLSARPSEVKMLLQRTPQGCAWMADRWRNLLAAVEQQGDWDEGQILLAVGLLGLETGDPMPFEGPVDPAELALAEIARLQARIEELAEVDARERELAECGMGPVVEKAVRHVRRYERAALRRIEWALGQLRRRDLLPDPTPDPDRHARPDPDRPDMAGTEPTPAPAPGRETIAARTKPIAADPPAPPPFTANLPGTPTRPKLADALRPSGPGGNRRSRRAGRRPAA